MSHPNPNRMVPFLGAAGLALGLLVGCESRPAASHQKATPVLPPPGSAADGGAPTSVVVGQLTLSSAMVTSGEAGYHASVPLVNGGRYQWSITGGQLTSSDQAAEVTYRVDEGANLLRLLCKMYDAGGKESIATVSQVVVPPPVLERFEASARSVTAGSPVTLQWVARQVKRLTLEPGGQDVTTAGQVQVRPSDTVTYTLRAVNEAGTARTLETTVKVIGAPEIRALGAEGPLVLGSTVSLKAEFARGRAELWDGSTLLGSSDQSPLVVPVTLREGLNVTLKVVNEAGATASQTWAYTRGGK